MKCKVQKTLAAHGMIFPGATVCVALSGGADSMALLCVLDELKEDAGFSLCAAHINHGIRGEEAERDEAFVTEQCRLRGIPLYKTFYDVPAICRETGEGTEECGRRLRYDFLHSVHADLIATAHNLNDRTETFLFHFARGSGGRGLCSIPYVRGKVIRPLLDCTRREIEVYCAENAISYVHDSTNDDTAYARNRIRHAVMPELRELNPAFEEAALRCMNTLAADEDYLQTRAEELMAASRCTGGYDAAILADAHNAVASRAIAAIVTDAVGEQPNYREIGEIRQLLCNGGQVQLAHARVARVKHGVLDFPVSHPFVFQSYPLCSGSNVFDGLTVDLAVSERNASDFLQNVNTKSNIYWLDYDKISDDLRLRNRCNGDSVRLAGRHCTKTLKKLFNELAVPIEKRDEVLLVADDTGILLVEGFGVCERAAVAENTRKILKISFLRGDEN